jgi:hypothetical protein
MTRMPRPAVPQSSATSTLVTQARWSQILRIACHLAEYREPLHSAIAERDLEAIRASLMAHEAGIAPAVEDASIASAIALATKTPWLFGKRWRPGWLRLAGLLDGIDRHKALTGVAGLAGLAVVLVGVHFWRSHSYAHWQAVVTPLAGEAAQVQQKADIAIRLASNVAIVPLGATVHAESALFEINKVNIEMHDLIVTSTDPVILRSIYAQHSDAQEVAAHDGDLLRLATHHLQLARDQLDQADKVLAYGKKWHDLNPYVALPDGLAQQWTSVAATMSKALGAGDIQNIEQADLRLENIGKGAEIVHRADTIADSLSADDRVVAAPYLATIENVVARGEPDQAKAALATLMLMQKQLPMSYSLYLSSIPGEQAFVVKPDAHDASTRHYYLIVHATDTHGAPVSVDIHDTGLDKDVDINRFGIEVSADTFQQVQAQNQKDESLVLVGSKSAGTAATAFALPVLDGRITVW